MRTIAILLVVAAASPAGDWSSSGGDSGRNGSSEESGPLDASGLLRSGGGPSLIAWQPVTEGGRLFLVRQASWPGTPGDSPVVCMDLLTGEELWTADVPYAAGDWITRVGGVRNGLVYACRGGNGASVSAPLHALRAEDGGTEWISEAEIDAGAYDGIVFAEDGDPIIASFRDIRRISSEDGSTVRHASRTGSVSGQCGGCLSGDAFYAVDAASGGHRIVRYDADTGAEMHASPVMPGFTAQCTPMAGPDGSLYFVIPGPRLARVDPGDGTILDQSGILRGYASARMAVDAEGTVFFSDGGTALPWDGLDDSGVDEPAGAYVIRAVVGGIAADALLLRL